MDLENARLVLENEVVEQTWKIGGFNERVQSGQWSISLSILTTTSALAAALSIGTSTLPPLASSSPSGTSMGDSSPLTGKLEHGDAGGSPRTTKTSNLECARETLVKGRATPWPRSAGLHGRALAGQPELHARKHRVGASLPTCGRRGRERKSEGLPTLDSNKDPARINFFHLWSYLKVGIQIGTCWSCLTERRGTQQRRQRGYG
jgi:hypothetical protein